MASERRAINEIVVVRLIDEFRWHGFRCPRSAKAPSEQVRLTETKA